MKLSQIIIIEAAELDLTGIDPSVAKELSEYKPHLQQWAIGQIKSGKPDRSVIDAVEVYQKRISDNRFIDILKKMTPSPKNILTLTLDDVKTAQAQFDELYSGPSKRELKKLRRSDYTTTLADVPYVKFPHQLGIKIIMVEKKDETQNGAKILSDLARGTKWCVTDPEIGDDYLKKGPIYLITTNYGEPGLKDTITHKMLCHPSTHQLMDPKDEAVIFKERVEEDELEGDEIGRTLIEYRDAKRIAKYFPEFMIFAGYDYHLDSQSSKAWYRQQGLKYPKVAFEYATNEYNRAGGRRRDPQLEAMILKDPMTTYNYIIRTFNAEWPEAEATILTDPFTIVSYAHSILKRRWPEGEKVILEKMSESPKKSNFDYSLLANYMASYAYNVIHGRWVEAEPYIAQYPFAVILYASSVLNRRWPEAEAKVLESPRAAAIYSKEVINGRWQEAEPLFFNNVKDSADEVQDAWNRYQEIYFNATGKVPPPPKLKQEKEKK